MGINKELSLVMVGLCPRVVKALSSVGGLSPLSEKLAVHHIQCVRKNRLIKGIWEQTHDFSLLHVLCVFLQKF